MKWFFHRFFIIHQHEQKRRRCFYWLVKAFPVCGDKKRPGRGHGLLNKIINDTFLKNYANYNPPKNGNKRGTQKLCSGATINRHRVWGERNISFTPTSEEKNKILNYYSLFPASESEFELWSSWKEKRKRLKMWI